MYVTVCVQDLRLCMNVCYMYLSDDISSNYMNEYEFLLDLREGERGRKQTKTKSTIKSEREGKFSESRDSCFF